MKQANPIDVAIVKLASQEPKVSKQGEQRFWILEKPEPLLSEVLGDQFNLTQIRDRIRQLKSGKHKLITTKSSPNGAKYIRLDISEQFFVNVNGFPPAVPEDKEAAAASGATPEVEQSEQEPDFKPDIPAKKLIYVVVDYENIVLGELQLGVRVSFYRLREYIRGFGVVKEAKIFWPLKFLDRTRTRELTYLTSTNGGVWQVVICGQTTKDKDQVDFQLAQNVRDQCYYHPDMEIWIISRDSDFLALVEQSRDRGLNNIKLVNPFHITAVLGAEQRESELTLSRNSQMIVDAINRIKPNPQETEHATAKLIRYSAGFLLIESSVRSYSNFDALNANLKRFLKRYCCNEFQGDPGFYKNVTRAFREIGILAKIGRGDQSQILINTDHHKLGTIAPPHFMKALTAANGGLQQSSNGSGHTDKQITSV